MANPTRSIDDLLAENNTSGGLTQILKTEITSSTTVATINSGGQTMQRFQNVFTVPTMGGSVLGAYCTHMALHIPGGAGMNIVGGLEVDLGTLTVSGNSFSAGSSMPSRPTAENSTPVQSAALFNAIYVSASVTATTPVVTITYTNQDGTTGRTASLTLNSNPAVNSMFSLRTHLQSGDTGIRAVTNMSISTGSAGTIKAIGILPIAIHATNNSSGAGGGFPPLGMPISMPRLAAGDNIGFYRIGANAAGALIAVFQLNAET